MGAGEQPSSGTELLAAGRAERVESEIAGRIGMLIASVMRHDIYSTDADDEFRITREDGTEQGIFKVWAAPVIPRLDMAGRTEADVEETWSQEMSQNPLSLHESLEQWRAFSQVADRRLQTIFTELPLPDDPKEAMAELFLRMNIAFAYGAPFYNLEALIVDSRADKTDNPIDFTEHMKGGGSLDSIAMMIPAAFSDFIKAEKTNWNGLNWPGIEEMVSSMREDFMAQETDADVRTHPYRLLVNIAAEAHVDPNSILYAANLMEFIPDDVAGKRVDLTPQGAAKSINKALDAPRTVSTSMVAKNSNALIRFLNWCPVIRDDRNFEGRLLSYGAACDTAADLAALVAQNPDQAFAPDFVNTYSEHLHAQLEGLDAASAKGRFMLQLMTEGRFNQEITDSIAERSPDFLRDILGRLELMAEEEAVADVATTLPTYLCGGKAEGIHKAMMLFGEDAVLGGEVITTEAVASWLQEIPGMDDMLAALEDSPSGNDKLYWGEAIRAAIAAAEFSPEALARIAQDFGDVESIVLRSSSFDEDVDIIGPAPGIYESVVGIDPRDPVALEQAFKEVVGSFFSEKAISFRELQGLRQKPLMAVLVQKCLHGAGGTAFVKDGVVSLNIAQTAEAINSVFDRTEFESFSFANGDEVQGEVSRLIAPGHLAELVFLARKTESVLGASDLEFSIDETGALKLLQLRSLERPAAPTMHEDEPQDLTAVHIVELDNLPDIENEHAVNLVIDAGINLEKFQGPFFRWLIGKQGNVRAVTISHDIPTTCHFANIIESLGISLRMASE